MEQKFTAEDAMQGVRRAIERNNQRRFIVMWRQLMFPQMPAHIASCFRPIAKNNGGRKMYDKPVTACTKQIHVIG
jgi:hypothetical protein